MKIGESVPIKIYSDMKRFKQILFNLMGNAIKFTFKGKVTVNINFDERTNNLVTDVEDTGVGIKPEDLLKLFRFFGTLSKTKDINRGGMGLGLTISKMIVKQLGGEISVSSKPNVGSKFSFSLPIDQYEPNKLHHSSRKI